MLNITCSMPTTQTAPKTFKCSKCRGVVQQGQSYVKAGWGSRYCAACSSALNK